MCVCLCLSAQDRTGCSFENDRFGPRGDDKAIKFYVSHINCFDLFFLIDSWLNGNKGHFTRLERVLKSAKYEETASEEINRGKCLSSMGSKHTACSLVFMLWQFPKRHLKNGAHLFQHGVPQDLI